MRAPTLSSGSIGDDAPAAPVRTRVDEPAQRARKCSAISRVAAGAYDTPTSRD